jgi:TatD DNase family protein
MMHSYSGSPDLAKMLIKLPRIGSCFYFSFSFFVSRRLSKLEERLKAIPENRLLIESDLDDVSNVDDAMLEMVKTISDARGWSMEECINILERNTREFLESMNENR